MVKAPKHLLVKVKVSEIKLGHKVQIKTHTVQKVRIKSSVQNKKRRQYDEDEDYY